MQEIMNEAPVKGARLRSLDIFRGITIATMITVNNPGIEERVYAPLAHAKWNGITPTDFVFPSFVFIVGVSIAFSYSRQLAQGVTKQTMIRKTIRRAATLFVLGVFLSVLPYLDLANYRLPGVLQRISIVYAVCAPLFLYTSWRRLAWIGASILVGYCMLMTLVPVPGYGYAILEPGQNLAAWLDRIVIPGRFYQGSWDPEGVLSTFPAIATGIGGMLAGRLLLGKLTPERKVIGLYLAGFIAFALANAWNGFFPVNKNLWTSSFVLYVGGLDCMILASLYFWVDVSGHTKGWGWARIFGSNAIAAYLVAEALGDLLTARWGARRTGLTIDEWAIEKILPLGISPELLSLLWALGFGALCFLPVYFLYRKKIFLKI